jgi:molecular chaperone HtpG
VAKGELDLDKLADEEEKAAAKQNADEYADLVKRMQDNLGERVAEVRVSQRLTESPSCLVMGEHDMAVHMQQMLRQAGHDIPHSKPILEINPAHPLVSRLKAESDDARFADWSAILLDQAMLSEGGQLDDPVNFVNRLNQLLLTMTNPVADG